MRRRDFISLAGSAVIAWPFTAPAQQPGRIRRVGVLSAGSTATGRHLVEAFFESMTALQFEDDTVRILKPYHPSACADRKPGARRWLPGNSAVCYRLSWGMLDEED
jgi:hypothetical protein